jgi:hypothetical protein
VTQSNLIRQALIGGVLLATMGCVSAATLDRQAVERSELTTHVSVMMQAERAVPLTVDAINADPRHAGEITGAAVTSAPNQAEAITAAAIATAPSQEGQIRAGIAEARAEAVAATEAPEVNVAALPREFPRTPFNLPRGYRWDFSQPSRY